MTERPLAIGLMTPSWPTSAAPNGIVTYVSTLAPELAGLGHSVSLLAGEVTAAGGEFPVYETRGELAKRPLPRRILDGVWHRLSPRSAWRGYTRRSVVSAARRMLAERRLDVLEVEESFGWASALRRLGVPVHVRLHGPWFLAGPALGVPDDEEFRWRVREEGRAIAEADAVSAPAGDVLERVRAQYGLALPGAEVIPNPTARVDAASRWTSEGCDRDRILFVGRFDRLKGGDLLVEAFGQVLRRRPGARLWFVGPDLGITGDDGRTTSLEKFVRDRIPGALERGQVEWLGRQPSSALGPLRRRAAVTVVCSRYENFPGTAIEAMAAGCPLVAAAVGGIPSIVADGVNGVLHRGGDRDSLADALLMVLGDPALAARIGRRASEDADRSFSPRVVAERLQALYRRISGAGAKAG